MNWNSGVRTNKRQSETEKGRDWDREREKEGGWRVSLSCESAVIYFILHGTQEMHFDDGIRTNGFSSHIIICGGEI